MEKKPVTLSVLPLLSDVLWSVPNIFWVVAIVLSVLYMLTLKGDFYFYSYFRLRN